MCGRMAITLPTEAMTQLFNAMPANDLPAVPNYNVCPTDKIHAIISDKIPGTLKLCAGGFCPIGINQ